MEGLGDGPPLWADSPISAHRRRSSSPLLSQPILIVLVPLLALLLLYFLAPPFISASSQFVSPAKVKVKKSWDSLNILLVLFAIICGIFARRHDANDANINAASKVPSSTTIHVPAETDRWFDTKVYDAPTRPPVIGAYRLRRTSSSYPDLRAQEFVPENAPGEDRFRFFDDFEIDKYRMPEFQPAPLRRWRSSIDESNIKVIPVDTFVLQSTTPPASPTPQTPPMSPATPSAPPPPAPPAPPPPPAPPASRQKQRRNYEAIGTPPAPPPPTSHRKQRRANDADETPQPNQTAATPPPPPPMPPRPPPSPAGSFVKRERRKSNATKELKLAIASVLRNQRKRKKKQKNRTILENADQAPAEIPQHSTRPPPSPPPPPPPPPPPSFFQNLFRKSSKSKKIHSVSQQLPPHPPPPPRKQTSVPPPPPPPQIRKSGKPPLPTRTRNYDAREDGFNLNSCGNQSPLIPIPPPPPPPPFKLPELRFVARGDFVRIRSTESSRCGSPEPNDAGGDEWLTSSTGDQSGTVDGTDGRDASGGAQAFCPSPDVNIKADTFIARLKDEWRLEKINSMREKEKVGPNP